MQNNRILLILILMAASISASLAWYLFTPQVPEHSFASNRAQIQDADTPPEQLADANIDSLAQRRAPAVPISAGKAVSALYMDRGLVQYYDPDNGQVWQVASDGTQSKLVSGALLQGFSKSIWSPTKHEVLSIFSTTRGDTYKYFDYTNGRSVSLGTKIKSAAFSPDGSELVYFSNTEKGGSIFLSTPDGQESKEIFSTRLGEVRVQWGLLDTLAFISTEPQTNLMSLFLLSTDKELTKLIDGVLGLETKWSSDGSRILFSYFDNGSLTTGYVDPKTEKITQLGIQARASECAWTSNVLSLICAVSQTPISMAVLETQSKTPADFYEISLDSTKKLLYSSGTRSARASVSEIFLSATGDYVFFINRYDSKLYSFKR